MDALIFQVRMASITLTRGYLFHNTSQSACVLIVFGLRNSRREEYYLLRPLFSSRHWR